jgi:hypothetical protein
LFKLIGALAMLALVLAAWAAHRLSEGPLSLSGLSPYIEQALSRPENGFSVKVGDTILTWNKPSHSLEIQALDVHMLAEDGHQLATFPEMSVALSGAALMRGKLVPRAIRLNHPVLHLVRGEDGSVSLGIGGAETSPDAPPDANSGDVAKVGFDALMEPPGKETLAGQLQRIQVTGGIVTIDDRKHGISWTAPNSDLTFRRDERGIALHARLDLDLEGQPGHLDADGIYLHGDRVLDLTLQAGGIKPATVAKLAPQLDFLAGMQAPVGGSVSLRYAFGTGFTALKTDLAAGEGVFDLTSTAGFSLPVKSVRVRAGYQNSKVTLDELRIDLGGPILTATGAVDGIGGEMKLGLQAQIDGVGLDELAGIWPKVLAPSPRAWVTSNLSHGAIQSVTASLQGHVPVGKSLGDIVIDKLEGGMGLQDVTVRYMDQMPVVEHVDGAVIFDSDVFTIDLKDGAVAHLAIPEAKVVLAGLSKPSGQTADITVRIGGALTDILRFIDNPPLGYTTKLGLDPGVVKGDGLVDLSLRFPLVDNLSLDRLKIKVEADTKGLFLPKQVLDLDLVDANLHLSVDNDGLDALGPVQIDGRPGLLKWRENFGPTAAFRSRYQVSGQLSDEGRKLVGLGSAPFQPPYLSGVLPVSVIAVAQSGGRFDISAKADLTPAMLAMPGLNFLKPAGVAAEAAADVELVEGKLTRVRQFHVGGKGLDVSGGVSFDKGEIERVTLTNASFARTQMSGSIGFRADGGLVIMADGSSFDAREIVHGRLTDPATDKAPTAPKPPQPPRTHPNPRPEVTPLSIQGRFGRIWLSDDGFLSNGAADLARDRYDWRTIHVAGEVGNHAPVSFDQTPLDATRSSLSITSPDAGSVLKAMDIFDNVKGGALSITGMLQDDDPARPLTGNGEIKDFQLLQAPVLAKLVTVAGLTGTLDLLSGQGIHFAALEMPFTYRDGILQIKDGQASGSAIGVTAKGRIDIDNDKLGLEGTVVPAYALNSALGNLPVVGGIFSAEKGGGLVAIDYQMKGSMGEPDFTVNPLSALTPGFLRGLFSLFDKPPSGDKPNQ